MSQVGVIESYIPGLEEIADEFIKLCKDHILDKNNDLTQKLGLIYKVNFLGFKQIMLSDPEHMETVLRSEGPNEDFPDAEYPKVPMLTGLYGTYKKMSTDLYPTNRGIIGIDGEEWWKARYLRNIHFSF